MPESCAAKSWFALEDTMSRYSLQFSQIYYCRFKALFPQLHSTAIRRWGEDIDACSPRRILEIQPKGISVIFGILFAELSNKPNVLDDLSGEVIPFEG